MVNLSSPNTISLPTSDSNLNYSSIAVQKSKIMQVLHDLENFEFLAVK